MKKFNIEVTYQDWNKQWGALVKKGNIVIFEVGDTVEEAVLKAVKISQKYKK